jgi:hypothetical protein
MGSQKIGPFPACVRLLLCAACGLAAPCAVAFVAQAQAVARAHPSVICPVRAARASVRPCCEPPIAQPKQPPCCPSNAAARPAVQPICCTAVCPAVSITISSLPDPARAGQPVTVKGVVRGGDRVRVALWQRRAGQRSFSRVAITTTSPSGAFAFTRPGGSVMRNTYWYASADAMRSATIEQFVRAIVTLRASRLRMARGAILHLSGTVRPPQRDVRAQILARVGRGLWRVVARPLLRPGGRFACSLRPRRAGRWNLRALVPSDPANLQGQSATLTVIVR